MLLDFLGLYGSERSEADMQRDKARFYAHLLYFFKKLLCEMKPGCRRCGTAELSRIYRLIALGILKLFLYIWRQRHFAELFELFKKNTLIVELDYSVSAVGNAHDRCRELTVTKREFRTGLCLSARPTQAFPAAITEVAQQDKLNQAAAQTRAYKPRR